MNRYTERDENGNAHIIGIESEDLYANLEFEQTHRLTSALNKLADFEDLCQEMQADGPKGPIEALRNKLGFMRFSDGYNEEIQQEVHSIDFIPYCEEYTKLNKRYIKASKTVRDFVNELRQKYQERPTPSIITLSAEEIEEFFKKENEK